MTQNQDNSKATRSSGEPVTLLKRIGTTSYVVTVHFSETSKETIEDKILRMIESEVGKTA